LTIIALVGHLAVTTNSLVALGLLTLHLGICAAFSVTRRSFGWLDIPLCIGLATVQIVAVIAFVPPGGGGLNMVFLAWPLLLFLSGYGLWRVAGGVPLRHWPWHRFGMVAGLTVLLVDVGVGLLMPVPAGRIWQLGGAGLLDALAMLPPVLTMVFWGLLDCDSPMTFCCGECRNANRCRFGLDGRS
jgi:hypothetical protein